MNRFEENGFRILGSFIHENAVVRNVIYVGDDIMVSTSTNDDIKFWNIRDNKRLALYNCENSYLYPLANIKKFVSASIERKSMRVWCASSHTSMETQTQGYVKAAVLLNECTMACAEKFRRNRFYFNNITIWFIDGCLRKLHTISQAHEDTITCLRALPNNFYASGSEDNKIKIWNSSQHLYCELVGHKDTVTDLRAWRDNFLISSSNDGSIRVWSVKDKNCINALQLTNDRVRSLSIIDNNYFACYVGWQNAKILIFDYMIQQCSSIDTSHFFEIIPKRFDYFEKNRFVCLFDDTIIVYDFLKERDVSY